VGGLEALAPSFWIHQALRNIRLQLFGLLFTLSINSHKFLSCRPEPNTVKMAPQKKNKKDSNTINAKLSLVMKSGKGTNPSIRLPYLQSFIDQIANEEFKQSLWATSQVRSIRLRLGNLLSGRCTNTAQRSRACDPARPS
jgi:hypothetical protein